MKMLAAMALIIASNAFAQPADIPSGNYKFKDFQVSLKKHFVAVVASTAEGKKRLSELRAESYECAPKGSQNFLCSKFLSNESTKEELREIIESRYQNLAFTISERSLPPELVAKGESAEEWLLHQQVRFGEKKYPHLRHFTGKGIKKIFLGQPAEETLVIMNDESLHHSILLNRSESTASYFMYLVLVGFTL